MSQNIFIVGDQNGISAQIFFVDEGGIKTPAPVVATFWFAWYVAHPQTEIYK